MNSKRCAHRLQSSQLLQERPFNRHKKNNNKNVYTQLWIKKKWHINIRYEGEYEPGLMLWGVKRNKEYEKMTAQIRMHKSRRM